MIIIRDATEADLPAILAIYNRVIATSTSVYTEMPSTRRTVRLGSPHGVLAISRWWLLWKTGCGALPASATFAPGRAMH